MRRTCLEQRHEKLTARHPLWIHWTPRSCHRARSWGFTWPYVRGIGFQILWYLTHNIKDHIPVGAKDHTAPYRLALTVTSVYQKYGTSGGVLICKMAVKQYSLSECLTLLTWYTKRTHIHFGPAQDILYCNNTTPLRLEGSDIQRIIWMDHTLEPCKAWTARWACWMMNLAAQTYRKCLSQRSESSLESYCLLVYVTFGWVTLWL